MKKVLFKNLKRKRQEKQMESFKQKVLDDCSVALYGYYAREVSKSYDEKYVAIKAIMPFADFNKMDEEAKASAEKDFMEATIMQKVIVKKPHRVPFIKKIPDNEFDIMTFLELVGDEPSTQIFDNKLRIGLVTANSSMEQNPIHQEDRPNFSWGDSLVFGTALFVGLDVEENPIGLEPHQEFFVSEFLDKNSL